MTLIGDGNGRRRPTPWPTTRRRPAAPGRVDGRWLRRPGADWGWAPPPAPGARLREGRRPATRRACAAAIGIPSGRDEIGHAGGGAAQSVGRRRPFDRGQGQEVDQGARIPTEIAGAVEPGPVTVPPLSQTDHLPPVVGHHLAGPHPPEAHRRRPPGADHVPATVGRDPGEPQVSECRHPAVPQPVEGTADVIPPQRIAGRHPDVDPRRILRGHQHRSPARSPPGHLDPGRRRPTSVDRVLGLGGAEDHGRFRHPADGDRPPLRSGPGPPATPRAARQRHPCVLAPTSRPTPDHAVIPPWSHRRHPRMVRTSRIPGPPGDGRRLPGRPGSQAVIGTR